MRKILLLTLLISSVCVNARHISPEDARSVALEFFGSGTSQKKAPGTGIKLETAVPSVSSTDWQPYYTFNNGDNNGFVIISGDDRAPKVLGYSDKGSFDSSNMPPQLKALLYQFATGLDSLPESSSSDSSWTSMPTRSEDQGVLLETANWGQGYPYNAQCPIIDGVQAPTGCVATAMAIVMKYHNWPNRGRSEHSYEWNGQQYAFDFNNETFDWSQMPLEFVENEFSSIQVEEVSKLMLAAGNSVDMMYSSNESAASADNIPYHLYRFFRYNIPSHVYKSGGCPNNRSYSDEEWLNHIKEQIDARNPLLYSYIGHMYVVDGYNSEGLLHVNWGWDGIANGYYAINQMGLEEAVISYIIPEYTEDDSFETVVLSDGSLSDGAQYLGCALNINTTDIIPNEDYEVAFTCITQTRKDFGPFHVALALTDNKGKIKELLTSPMDINGFGTEDNGIVSSVNGSWGIKIDHDIDPTDLITCVIKKVDEPEERYRPIKTPYHIKPYLKVQGNTPLYNTINLDIGEDIFVTKYCPQSGYANIGNLKALNPLQKEISYLANSQLTLYATANHGIPHITLGDAGIGKFENYKYNRSVYASIRSFNHGDVTISLIPFEDMLDLDLDLEREGILESKINSGDYKIIKSLKLSGLLNIEDFIFINLNLENLQTLDLSDATIVPNEINFKSIQYLNFLKELRLPSNLEKIGDLAFFFPSQGCLEIMDIPASVNSISGYAFEMPSLDTYIVHTTEPIKLETPEKTFCSIHNGHVLYVPRGSKEKYSTADGWKNFKTIIEYDDDWKLERKEQNISLSVNYQDNLIVANCQSNSDEYGMRSAVDIFVIEGAENVEIVSIEYGGSRDCTLKLRPKTDSFGEILLEGRKDGDGHFAPAEPVQKRITIKSMVSGITFEEENLILHQGEEQQLTPSISPSFADKNQLTWSSSDEAIATVDTNGKVTAIALGEATITATCGEVSASCTVKCYPKKGDAKMDGDVTVADAVEISNYVVGKIEIDENMIEFFTVAADVNEDSYISISDACATVDIVLESEKTSSPAQARRRAADNDSDHLLIGGMNTAGGKCRIAVKLDTSQEYVALQADILLPEGVNFDVIPGSGISDINTFQYRRLDANHVRIAIFSPGKNAFSDNDDIIFEIVTDSSELDASAITMFKILASDADANEYVLGAKYNVTTAVYDPGCDTNAAIKVYDLNGRYVSDKAEGLDAGFYIIRHGNNFQKVRIR